jgi:hypothetical protein
MLRQLLCEPYLIVQNLKITFGQKAQYVTYDPVSQVAATQLEDVLLVPVVWEVFGLNLQGELLHKRTGEASLGVRVRIPRLLLHAERGLGQQRLDPSCRHNRSQCSWEFRS